MKIKYSAIITLALIIISCEDSSPPYYGTTTLNNVILKKAPPIFSFEHGKVIYGYDSLSGDFDVQNQINDDGELIGVFLTSVGFNLMFNLLSSYTTNDSASNYYDTLSVVPEDRYRMLAIPILPNQIWAVKTNINTYAKIHIIKTEYYQDNLSLYASVTFRWYHQRNGERYF